jgi:hypothetical protein
MFEPFLVQTARTHEILFGWGTEFHRTNKDSTSVKEEVCQFIDKFFRRVYNFTAGVGEESLLYIILMQI